MGVMLRDFIQTDDGLIFASVSYSHPEDRYIAFLRYYPCSSRGSRRGYCKVASTSQSFTYLRRHHPEYLYSFRGTRLQAVPREHVGKVLRPRERLAQIVAGAEDALEAKVARLAELFSRAVPLSRLGVTGSLLPRLHLPGSDIDLVVYGRRDHLRARRTLAELLEEGAVQELSPEEWRRAYEKRFPHEKTLSFSEFLWHERRKFHRASFQGTSFDLLLVRENVIKRWDEESYTRLGIAELECTVVDASLAFDYPARYRVSCEKSDVEEVVSYTHTYAGQAFEGERILARGWLEEVSSRRRSYLRLVVGTTREAAGEYIKLLEPQGSSSLFIRERR
ncbi:nucleotidyltransferase domain-containing protein [Candidatus Pyrohabitans sp.]